MSYGAVPEESVPLHSDSLFQEHVPASTGRVSKVTAATALMLVVAATLALVAFNAHQIGAGTDGLMGGLTELYSNDLNDACNYICDKVSDCSRTQCGTEGKCKYLYYPTKEAQDADDISQACYAYGDIATATCPVKYKVKCEDVAEEDFFSSSCSLDRKGSTCETGPVDFCELAKTYKSYWEDDPSVVNYVENFCDVCGAATDKTTCESTTIDTSTGGSYSCQWYTQSSADKSACGLSIYTQSLIAHDEELDRIVGRKGDKWIEENMFGLYNELKEICHSSWSSEYENDLDGYVKVCGKTNLAEVFHVRERCYFDYDVYATYGMESACLPKSELVLEQDASTRFIYGSWEACAATSKTTCESSDAEYGVFFYRGFTTTSSPAN